MRDLVIPAAVVLFIALSAGLAVAQPWSQRVWHEVAMGGSAQLTGWAVANDGKPIQLYINTTGLEAPRIASVSVNSLPCALLDTAEVGGGVLRAKAECQLPDSGKAFTGSVIVSAGSVDSVQNYEGVFAGTVQP